MPPRGRGAQSEEAKQNAFKAWMESDEHAYCKAIYNTRKFENHELKELHPGSDDILDDWQPVLNNIFKLAEGIKLQGRKSKCKSTSLHLPTPVHPINRL